MMAAAQPETTFEIKHSSIYFCQRNYERIRLGEGAFGVAFKGHYKGETVAVKIVRDENRETLDISHQIEMAVQVACGMDYLEKKSYLHRDLAARNVLVGENVYKVADFGLARVLIKAPSDRPNRKYYKAIEGVCLPIRWTAPEAIVSKRFTIKNDVWSFGILLYEIMTFGMEPYANITNNNELIKRVTEGYRMPCPKHCPVNMYQIMSACWKTQANDRPLFESLQTMLSDLQ